MDPAEGSPSSAAQVRPLDVDGVGVTTVGTAIFAVATLAAILLRDRLAAADDLWWLWVAVTGTVLGLLLMGYTRRRARVYAAARAAQE